MAFVERGDIRLFYERRGQGPRLLVITGTNGDLRRKPSVMESPLTRRFALLAYDQRGLGQSSKPDRPYRMTDYADDAAQVMEAVGWKSARVLGISFGGMVAQEFALRHPQKVERLALCCTAPGGRGGASYPLHELIGLTPQQRAESLLAVQDTRRDAAWVAAGPARAQAALDELMARARPIDPSDPNMAMGSRRQIEARRDHDTFDRLPQMKMPVGIFAGKYDGVAKPEAQEAMRRQIPQASLHFFDGGHLFTMQDPAAYPAIGDFLAGGG
jgi:3-oxoadipate enol-lactonase